MDDIINILCDNIEDGYVIDHLVDMIEDEILDREEIAYCCGLRDCM